MGTPSDTLQPPGDPAWNPRQHLAGFPLGILCIDSHYPLIPGNMQNAATYSFAPLYGIVSGVEPALLLAGDPALAPRILAACRQLVEQGARAIVGACGSFAHYQQLVRTSIDVPVCMSILVQIPFLLSILPARQRLLVYFASRRSLSDGLLAACEVSEQQRARLAIEEAWDLPAFQSFMARPSMLDVAALRRQLVEHVSGIVARNPDIGGIVLQCSDFPPFARDLQKATALPVHDGTLVAEWLFRAVRRCAYAQD